MSDPRTVHKSKAHGFLVLLPAFLLGNLLITRTETITRTTKILIYDRNVKSQAQPAPKEYLIPKNEEKAVLSYMFLLPLVRLLGP